MPHESITDEYVAELQARFLAAAELVKDAPGWPETQRRMNSGTYAYIVAMGRVNEGWSREQITAELVTIRLVGNLPGAGFQAGE
jgi:hypothetical protein